MADIGLSAFALFFMGSPSFLAHQRALEEGHGRSNCQTLFGISAIPTDSYMGVSEFLCVRRIQSHPPLGE
jgi:hypothetical protein